jgi:hypothetical protein
MLAASVALLGLVATAQATPVQGTEGATSTGSLLVTASVAARVQISNLSDLTFADADLGPVISSGGTAQKTENVCVWSNNTDKGYFITASGSGTASAFTLASGINTPVAYGVAWAGTTGASSGTALTAATKSTKFTSTANTSTCAGGQSATLLVSIAGADATNMVAAASYTGTLTLLVTPT